MGMPDFKRISEDYPDFNNVTSAIQAAALAEQAKLTEGQEINMTSVILELANTQPDIFTDMFWIEYLVMSRATSKIDDYFFKEFQIASARRGDYSDQDGGLTLYETFADKPFNKTVIRRYRQ